MAKASSSAETQETENELRSAEEIFSKWPDLMNGKENLSKEQRRSTFRPRPLRMFLTLKMIFDSKSAYYVKYSFGMIRGVFKEYQRSKSPKRYLKDFIGNNGNFSESKIEKFRGLALKTKEIKNVKGFELESPSFADLDFGQAKAAVAGAGLRKGLRELEKFWLKRAAFGFGLLKKNWVEMNELWGNLKVQMDEKVLGSGKVGVDYGCEDLFNSDVKMKTRVEFSNIREEMDSFKSIPTTLQNSHYRKKSFDSKDQELFRQRHPVKIQSPSPPLYPRFSLNLSPNSTISSSENRFQPFPERTRRNTIDAVKPRDSLKHFKPEISEESESSDIIDVQEHFKIESKPKKSSLRSAPKKEVVQQEKIKKEDFWLNRPLFKQKKIEEMVKKVMKNLDKVKMKAFGRIKEEVKKLKNFRKTEAAGNVFSFLEKLIRKRLGLAQKHAIDRICFSGILKKDEEKKERVQALAKPEKKIKLRAAKPVIRGRGSEDGKAEKFVEHLDFLRTCVLKSKLLGFLSIIDSLHPSPSTKPQQKSALRSIFRILESKRFLNICKTFQTIRTKLSQLQKLKQKKYLYLSQKLLKLNKSHLIPAKSSAFQSIQNFSLLQKSHEKLIKTLRKIENRGKALVKPMILYSIISYTRRIFYSDRIKRLKLLNILKKTYLRKLASSFV